VASRCRVGLRRTGPYLLDDAKVVFAMHVCHSKPLIRRESPPHGMGKTARRITWGIENHVSGRVELLAAALQGALEHGPVQVVRRSRCVGCRCDAACNPLGVQHVSAALAKMCLLPVNRLPSQERGGFQHHGRRPQNVIQMLRWGPVRHRRRLQKEFAVWSFHAAAHPLVHTAKPLNVGVGIEATFWSGGHLQRAVGTFGRMGLDRGIGSGSSALNRGTAEPPAPGNGISTNVGARRDATAAFDSFGRNRGSQADRVRKTTKDKL